jgi:hypothetical protein
MCTVLLPPGGNPVAVKYIISFHPTVSAWDICCCTFCLFVIKKAAYLWLFLSDNLCPLHECSNYMLTAAGVWPACRLETNLFCWARQTGVVGRQHASRFGFCVATITSSKAVDFYFLVRSLSRLLCCVGSAANLAVPLDHTVTRIGWLNIDLLLRMSVV